MEMLVSMGDARAKEVKICLPYLESWINEYQPEIQG